MDYWFGAATNLTWQDYSVLCAILTFSIVLGVFLGREEKDTNDFFLGGKKVPYWAACLSFVATEISAVTIISVPATAYRENWEYLQFFVGSFAARVMISMIFIPAFYKYNCTSIYEFLRHRFGPETQYAGSVLFFVTRLMASGVRLMAACLAVSVLIGWHIVPTIVLFTIVGAAYIAWGGIKAVVWTNVVQALTFIVAGAAAIVFLVMNVDGGVYAIAQTADAAGKLNLFNWGPNVADSEFLKKMFSAPNIIWIAILNGFLGSLAAFGTDQELMQRLLTVETRKDSQRTMLLTPIGSLLVLLIYVSIGTCLYAFYVHHPGLPLPEKLDTIFPHFVSQNMPAYLRGLMLSAIVMASIDSPLGSLSSSFVMDIYKPLIKKNADEKHYLKVSRVSVVVFGIVLGLIAHYLSEFENILWLAFKIGGVTYGALLGVFLLGLLTKRVVNQWNVIAMTVSVVIVFALLILSEQKIFSIGWTWLLVIGTVITFGLAWLGGKPGQDSINEPV